MGRNYSAANKERRRTEAAQRQEQYDRLSVTEKLARLDQTFGVGQGAARQRSRLLLDNETGSKTKKQK